MQLLSLAAQDIIVTDLSALTPFIGPPLKQSFCDFYEMSPAEAERAVAKYRERYEKIGWLENTIYPGIGTMLAELQKKGFQLAVASSKPKTYVQRILDHFQLSQYFHCIEGSELNGARVDKKDVIAEVLRQWGNPPVDELLMIGDRKFDIIGARELGFDCVGAE